MLKKVKPIFKKTKIFYGMKQVWQISYPIKKNNGIYSPKEMYELAKQQLSKYTGKNETAMIGVLPKESKGKWLNGKTFKIDDIEDRGLTIMPARTDSDNLVWEKGRDFAIYVWGNNSAGGGVDDMHNDCLFKCIVEAINYDEIPEGFKPAYKFKRRLKLERDDKVPITKLAYLEDRFKVNFNVTGDKTFISTSKYQKTVNLKLKDEHYTLVHNNQKTKVF